LSAGVWLGGPRVVRWGVGQGGPIKPPLEAKSFCLQLPFMGAGSQCEAGVRTPLQLGAQPHTLQASEQDCLKVWGLADHGSCAVGWGRVAQGGPIKPHSDQSDTAHSGVRIDALSCSEMYTHTNDRQPRGLYMGWGLESHAHCSGFEAKPRGEVCRQKSIVNAATSSKDFDPANE
jgi:hypothetical protein